MQFFSAIVIFHLHFFSQSLCFPGDDAVYVNPTSRLALIGKCTQWCDGGDLSYEWSIMSNEFNIITVSIFMGKFTLKVNFCGSLFYPSLRLSMRDLVFYFNFCKFEWKKILLSWSYAGLKCDTIEMGLLCVEIKCLKSAVTLFFKLNSIGHCLGFQMRY